MSPLYLLPAFVVIWALIHFWLLRTVAKTWRSGGLSKRIGYTSILTILHKLRDLCAVGAVTVIFLLTTIGLLSFLGDNTLGLAGSFFATLSLLTSPIEIATQSYDTFLFWTGIVGSVVALYLMARTARKTLVAHVTKTAKEVATRLEENPGDFNVLKDDPLLHDQFSRYLELRSTLFQRNTRQLSSDQVTQIFEEMRVLFARIVSELSVRELNVEKVVAVSAPSASDRQKLRNRIVRMLASETLAKDLGLISRSLSYLATSLLLISLTAWVATPLANSFRIAMNNLAMQASHAHVDRDLDNEISAIEDVEERDPKVNPAAVAHASRLLAKEAVRILYDTAILERSVRDDSPHFVRSAILAQSPEGNRKATGRPVNLNSRNEILTSAKVIDKIEGHIEPKVAKAYQRNSQSVNALINWLETRYGRAGNPIDAQAHIISSMFAQSFGNANTVTNDPLIRQGIDITVDIGTSAVRTWAIAQAKA